MKIKKYPWGNYHTHFKDLIKYLQDRIKSLEKKINKMSESHEEHKSKYDSLFKEMHHKAKCNREFMTDKLSEFRDLTKELRGRCPSDAIIQTLCKSRGIEHIAEPYEHMDSSSN